MICFLVPNSRQTRRTISSGVSVNGPGLPVGEDRLGELAGGDLLAQLEGVEVGDDDFRLPELLLEVGRDDVALAVVVLRVVRQQHAQPVADGDAGRDDQEGVGEAGVLRVGALVERVPGDEHGHDDGLAGAGGHLERHARQAGVRGVVRRREVAFSIQASPYFLATSVR